MQYLVLGCFAFIMLYIFDLNKIFEISRWINISFGIGVGLLIIATTGILLTETPQFFLPTIPRLFFGILALGALTCQLYAIFFALPFKKTYVDGEGKAPLVDTGFFSLCRHPGVPFFIFLFFFLWLTTGIQMVFWAGIIWTIMDIIHVYVQDRWLFPRYLSGYEQYRHQVPFLIPDITSIKRCTESLRKDRSHESGQKA